jgi:hypothetical protein
MGARVHRQRLRHRDAVLTEKMCWQYKGGGTSHNDHHALPAHRHAQISRHQGQAVKDDQGGSDGSRAQVGSAVRGAGGGCRHLARTGPPARRRPLLRPQGEHSVRWQAHPRQGPVAGRLRPRAGQEEEEEEGSPRRSGCEAHRRSRQQADQRRPAPRHGAQAQRAGVWRAISVAAAPQVWRCRRHRQGSRGAAVQRGRGVPKGVPRRQQEGRGRGGPGQHHRRSALATGTGPPASARDVRCRAPRGGGTGRGGALVPRLHEGEPEAARGQHAGCGRGLPGAGGGALRRLKVGPAQRRRDDEVQAFSPRTQ